MTLSRCLPLYLLVMKLYSARVHLCSLAFFRVTGSGKGQWADRKVDDISASFSDATYVYTVTGENTATLSSVNTQYRTGRMWSVDLYLTFDTPTSGNFVLKDKSLDSGVSYTTHGTFILE